MATQDTQMKSPFFIGALGSPVVRVIVLPAGLGTLNLEGVILQQVIVMKDVFGMVLCVFVIKYEALCVALNSQLFL